jgi:hypothetical protein
MNRDLNVDRALERWLAEGPSQLPDHVIDGIVRQLEETHQRRSTWLPRRDTMTRMLLSVGGVAAAVLIAVVGFAYFSGGAGPNIGGAPTPSPSPAPTFTSERHGYSLLLPDESWTVVEMPGTWGHGRTFNPDGPGVDSVFREIGGQGTYILFNSQPVPSGTTLEQWAIDYDSANRRMWPECQVERSESAVLDGETARLNTYSCDDAFEAAALHGGRAYVIRVFGGDANRTTIDEWISRFRFTDR